METWMQKTFRARAMEYSQNTSKRSYKNGNADRVLPRKTECFDGKLNGGQIGNVAKQGVMIGFTALGNSLAQVLSVHQNSHGTSYDDITSPRRPPKTETEKP
jgi:hypothetical protein